jgi:hypothetical protein
MLWGDAESTEDDLEAKVARGLKLSHKGAQRTLSTHQLGCSIPAVRMTQFNYVV